MNTPIPPLATHPSSALPQAVSPRPAQQTASHRPPATGKWLPLIVPSLVLFFSLFITFALAQFLSQERDLARRQRFERTTTALTAEVRAKLAGYHRLLLQTSGTVSVFGPVSDPDWQRYVSLLAMTDNYPALLGLGLAELGPAGPQPGVDDSGADATSDSGADSQLLVLRHFTSRQSPPYQPPDQLVKALAAELVSANTDQTTQLPHLVVMPRDKNSGPAALYLPITPPGLNPDGTTSANSIMLVVAVVDLDQALAGLVPNQHTVAMTISPDKTVVVTPPGNGSRLQPRPATLTNQRTIQLANGSWTISYLDRAAADWRDFTATLTIILGTAISLLLFAVLYSLSNAKSLAQQLALNITADLKATSAQDEALLASIADGIIATDVNQTITTINQAARRLLGLESHHTINDHFHRVVTVLDDQLRPVSDESSFVSRVLNTHQPVTTNQLLFAKNDGTAFPVRLTASPVTNQGRVDGVVMVFQDITEEKQIENTKSEFINLASHQLRTPLSGIKWYLEMLIGGELGPLTDEQLTIAKNIDASNQRMIKLVKSLLQISRIESGKMVPDFQPTELAKVLEQAQHGLQPQWQAKHIKLDSSIDHLPAVETDGELVMEVFINLISNAIKYSPPESSIAIRLYRDNDRVVFSVADHGYGIPQEFQDKIFAKFFRGKNIRKHHTDGTGLGLYLVEMITKVLGGKVWFQSQENVGSTFWFSLPISHSAEAEQPPLT